MKHSLDNFILINDMQHTQTFLVHFQEFKIFYYNLNSVSGIFISCLSIPWDIFQVPHRFRWVIEQTLKEFFKSVTAGKDMDPSWKKQIYKIIARLDDYVPEYFKSQAFLEQLEQNLFQSISGRNKQILIVSCLLKLFVVLILFFASL